MKLYTAFFLGAMTLSAVAQDKVVAKIPPPAKPAAAPPQSDVAELKRELAIQKVKTAIAEANAAAANVANVTQQASQIAQQKKDETLALIESTKKELGYDDRYEWNFQVGGFVMKPQVGQEPPAK